MGTVALTCSNKKCGLGCPEGENSEFDASLSPEAAVPTSFVRRHPAITTAKNGQGGFVRTPSFDDEAFSAKKGGKTWEDDTPEPPIPPPPCQEAERESPTTPRAPAPAGMESTSAPGRCSAADWAAKQDEFTDLPPLPENWIYVRSRSTGEIYFYNTVSRKTTFSRPSDTEPDLPPGWTAVKSRTTGQTYYWHAATQKSQFKRPSVAAAAG